MFIRLAAAKELLSQIEARNLTEGEVVGVGVLKTILNKHIRNESSSFKINGNAFNAVTSALKTPKPVTEKIIKKQEIVPPQPVKSQPKPKVPAAKTARIKVTQARKATQKIRRSTIGNPGGRRK